jgi:transcriptional regulator with XRE-family HTH domain
MSKENAIRKINLVGEWLLDLLEQENISQRRLSALSGVGVATINRSIKGVVVPNRSTVQSLLFTLFGRDYERIERELEIYDYLKKRQKSDNEKIKNNM